MKPIVAFGELLWDLLPSETILGGAPFNFAYRAAALGDNVVPISRLGKDDLGKQAFEAAAGLGLRTEFLQWDEELPTGTVEVHFDARNNPDYLIVRDVAYDRIQWNSQLEQLASVSACICFGTLIQRAEPSRGTLENLLEGAPQAVKFLDINLRKRCYSPDTVASSLKAADILKLNEQEARQLAEILGLAVRGIPETVTCLLEDWSLDCVLVTLAENGAYAGDRDGRRVYVPGYDVDVVDSLGAGDAFSAAFVHSHLEGKSLAEACRFGNLLGALVATKRGGTTPVAAQEIESMQKRPVLRRYHPALSRAAAQTTSVVE
jgi:fructokinase